MDKKIIIHVDDDETQIAILEDNRLAEFFIEREDAMRIVGNIYKGKVSNVLPGMQSAFVNVGLEKDVFLHIDDIDGFGAGYEGEAIDPDIKRSLSIKDVLQVGQEIIIQILKEPLGTKGARGTTYITLPGRYCVLLPNERHVGVSRRIVDEGERSRLKALGERLCPKEMGLIIRTVASGTTEIDLAEIETDIKFLLQLWEKILGRIHKAGVYALIHNELNIALKISRDLFTSDVSQIMVDFPSQYEKMVEYLEFMAPREKEKLKLYSEEAPMFEKLGIDRQLDKALRTHVWLNCGGYIIIQKTEALTAIDVNTGKFTGQDSLEDTVFKTNLEAAYEIGRQVRLRDIGGIIILDFIDMVREDHKKKVMNVINEIFSKDKSKTTILGITEFGLVEITRKRVSKSLNEVLQQACPYCKGSGKVLASKVISSKARNEIIKIAKMSQAPSIMVNVHPEVASYLIGEEGGRIRTLETLTGKSIYIRPEESYHTEQILVTAK
ncbi:MAG TPA: Rne/Rng family ribonuclease [Candidatus Wallbacteria bacterium]|nr:Rne/Rng family ribonuclease [Candidatus Wallbacteria bacterium]